MRGMPDKSLESHPYGFSIRRGMGHSARLLEEFFVNVERLLHMDNLAISFHTEQPYGLADKRERNHKKHSAAEPQPKLPTANCSIIPRLS
jgi:hypothetical protein